MTSVERAEQALEWLAQENWVKPSEETVATATALAASFGKDTPPFEAGSPLDFWREEVEDFLAVALPTSVYGGDAGKRAAVLALRALAREQLLHEGSPATQGIASLILHHVVWAMAAYSLANDRVDLLAALAEVQIPSRYAEGAAVFTVSGLRHPTVFERGADRVYEDCRQWLLGLELRSALACWRRDADVEGSLAEAELFAVLIYARWEASQSYSQVVGTDGVAEQRLKERLADRSVEKLLSRIFDVDPERLDRLVGELYEQLIGPDQIAGRPLYPGS